MDGLDIVGGPWSVTLGQTPDPITETKLLDLGFEWAVDYRDGVTYLHRDGIAIYHYANRFRTDRMRHGELGSEFILESMQHLEALYNLKGLTLYTART